MKLQVWRTTSYWIGLFCAVSGAILLATAGGWTLGWHPLWAFSFLIFPPLVVRLALALCLLVSALAFAPFTYDVSRRTQSALRKQQPVAFAWFLLPLAALLFWLFREQTLHGDGEYKLVLLATHTIQSDPYIWKEPLDSLFAYTLTGWARHLGASPRAAETGMSVAAGVVYLAAVLYVAARLAVPAEPMPMHADRGPQRNLRLCFVVGLLALGSSQLWFGHVENYSLVTATSFATVALAIGYLTASVPLWLVGLGGGFSVSFHPQALFALPALLFLLKRTAWVRQVVVFGLSGLVGPLLTIGALRLLGAPWPDLANGYAGDQQLFFTLGQALAPAQLGQALNNLWLVAPLAPLWLCAGFWAWAQPALRQDRCFRYLTGVAAGLLLYHFTFRNELPRHQDWDLFAIVGPGFTVWGLYAWSRFAGGRRLMAVTVPLFSFALLFTVAWVGVNHAFTLIRPRAEQRALYQHYQLLDLRAQLPTATFTPNTPICAEAQNCERVAALNFTMPQNGDERPVIFAHAPAQVAFDLVVPQQASFLWLSPALDPVAWNWGGDGVQFQVSVRQNGGQQNSQETILWSHLLTPAQPADRAWQEALVPLTKYRGQKVTLILATLPGPADNNAGDRAGWGLPWLMRGTPDTRFD